MIASKRSYLKITDWEIDFYSRPIIDENGKKRWELLITSTSHLDPISGEKSIKFLLEKSLTTRPVLNLSRPSASLT